ncbi:MAG: EAL domain-containing protein [Candidatus Eremiobacteraeota bacterium]|nr:EAL domain-containing protein [Candidatus Eremiobacteraeota bacterium]MBV8356168.1 EAL domain-containing protein [Candidatus Eremiobacteraeota bacterium]
MHQQLRDAIDASEFTVHYQPIVSLHSERVVATEALVRWNDPRRGLIMPDLFIPFAEEHGLITSVDEFVLRRACIELRRLADVYGQDLRMAVNVSPMQFHRPAFVRRIARILEQEAVAPNRLQIEITETAILADAPFALPLLGELRSLGVQISLDDFGTGYSSLLCLKHFPFDFVKIDRSFVHDIVRNPVDQAIAKSIITLAHDLGLRVVAEGVETGGQLFELRRLGCDEVQGHLYGRPLSLKEIGWAS